MISFSGTKQYTYCIDMSNQRKCFDTVGKELNVKELDDWYNIKYLDIKDKGLAGLLASKYNASLAQALPKIYPEHNWEPWKFHRVAHVHFCSYIC
jgi:hypothetical protein